MNNTALSDQKVTSRHWIFIASSLLSALHLRLLEENALNSFSERLSEVENVQYIRMLYMEKYI